MSSIYTKEQEKAIRDTLRVIFTLVTTENMPDKKGYLTAEQIHNELLCMCGSEARETTTYNVYKILQLGKPVNGVIPVFAIKITKENIEKYRLCKFWLD